MMEPNVIIEDRKVIQKFLTTLDKINQEFKNIYESDGRYNINKGNIYCSSNSNQLPRIVMGRYNTHSTTKLVDDIFLSNIFTIIAPEYFEFRKDKKDPVCLIEICNGEYIKIQTEHLKKTLIFEYDNTVDDPNNFTVLGVDLRTEKDKLELIGSDVELTEDVINEMVATRGSGSIKRLLLDVENKTALEGKYYDDISGYDDTVYTFEGSKKFFPGIGKLTLKVHFNIYKKHDERNLYLVETVTDDKFFTIHHFDLCLSLQDVI